METVFTSLYNPTSHDMVSVVKMVLQDSEIERANALQRLIQQQGINIEDMLRPGYEAILLHSNSTIITGNEAAARLTGYSVPELTGLNAWTLFPPQSITMLMQKLADATEDPYQILARRRDGRHVHIEIRGLNLSLFDEPIRAVLLKQISQ